MVATRMPLVLALALAGGLAACVTGFNDERGQLAAQARSQLVGLSEADLLACAGNPDRSRQQGGIDFLTYANQAIPEAESPIQGTGFASSSSVFADSTSFEGVGSGVGLYETVRSDYCEATFSVVNGQVVGLDYYTPTGGGLGGQYRQCYDIVSSCL